MKERTEASDLLIIIFSFLKYKKVQVKKEEDIIMCTSKCATNKTSVGI